MYIQKMKHTQEFQEESLPLKDYFKISENA